MILPRHYKPKDGDIIYHYCGCSAFQAIVESSSLWFTDINSMNDLLEVKWGYRKFEKVASKLIKQVGKQFLDAFDEIYGPIQLHTLPLVACFSREGDVLSQWVRYAEDGTGLAIGFDAQYMTSLAVRPLLVTYDEDVQEKEVEKLLLGCFDIWQKEGQKFAKDDFGFVVSCGVDMNAYKNPAFREEAEVRLIHTVGVRIKDGEPLLVGTGGTSHGAEIPVPEIRFRFSGSLLRPYVALNFNAPNAPSPIKEIIVGPKHASSPITLAMLLNRYGHSGAKIKPSSASYG